MYTTEQLEDILDTLEDEYYEAKCLMRYYQTEIDKYQEILDNLKENEDES